MPPPDAATGTGVRIAVIDSGVHPGHPHIIAPRIGVGVAIRRDGTVVAGDVLDRLGHGTAVTAAIQEKAPDADILPVRVFHDALATSSRALATAIGWSLDAGVDIINLSLGTTNPAHRTLFAGLVARAQAQGALVVAPHAVDDQACWPGTLDGVLGVGLDWDVPRDRFRVEAGVLYASGYPRPIPGVAPRRNLHGVSFATAQASGFAACALAALPAGSNGTDVLRALLGGPVPASSAFRSVGSERAL